MTTSDELRETEPQGEIESIGKWESVDSYLHRGYGRDGDELGEVPISVARYTTEDGETGWIVAETPDEGDEWHGRYATREEAVAAAEALAEELDETPDLDSILSEIRETGYFDDADIVPAIVKAATEYSQGYLLVTPDIHQPVGTRWTTNGYLECDHITLNATYGTQEQAAEALLRAIQGGDDEE